MFSKSFGVTVIDVAKDSSCNLKNGDVISFISGSEVGNAEVFKDVEKDVKSGDYITMVVNNGPGGCVATRDGYLGLSVIDKPSTAFKLGMNIGGGDEVLLKLNDGNINNVIGIIDERIRILGLPETEVSTSDSFIKIKTIEIGKIKSLIANGNFEGKVWRAIETTNGTAEIKLDTNRYSFEVLNKKVKINNSEYEAGLSFLLEDIKFDLINVTNNSVIIEAVIFTNEDVLSVLSSSSYLSYNSNINAYELNVPVQISNASLEKFQKVLRGLKTSVASSQIVLDGSLVYYMDNEKLNFLNIPIPYEWVGKKIVSMPIICFKNSQQTALEEKLELQAILESGRLPDLEIVQIKHFEGNLKEIIFVGVLLTLSAVVILNLLLNFTRHKKIKLGIYSSLLVLAEFVCAVGAIAISQRVFTYGWIVDTPSIVGLIVLIGSGFEFAFSLSNRASKKFLNFFEIGIFCFSFLMLFTSWKGFGLTIIVGMIIRNLITKSLHEEIEKTI